MQYILLPGSPPTAHDLWQQCMSGTCTDLSLCCDDGVVSCHKAVLVSCVPWLKNSDTDTVIMPGILVDNLKDALKLFYITAEAKSILWYFSALLGNSAEIQWSTVASDNAVKIDVDTDEQAALITRLEADLGEFLGERADYSDSDELIDSFSHELNSALELNTNSLELNHDFDFNINSTKPDSEKENNWSTCKLCRKIFKSHYLRKKHLNKVHGVVLKKGTNKCKFCAETFKSLSSKEKHLVEFHGVTFDCEECGCKLSTGASAHRHKRTKHPELYLHHCEACGFGFKKKVLCDEHYDICQGNSSGAQIEKEDVMCSVCGKKLASKNALKGHMLIHEPNYGKCQCDICGKSCATKIVLKNHKRTQHEGYNSFPCEVCGKVISSPRGLREHIKRVHDKNFDKECPHCEYRASSNIDIKKHIEASHLGITYPCDQCNMAFNQYSTLYSHKSVHSEDRPFVCQKCGTGFKKKKGLERHISTLHSTSTHPCKDCGKVFKSEAYLSDHMRAHDEDRQFPCSFCTRKFVTRTKLRMHINTHTGERPYKCPYNCGKAFHSSDQLSHHKKQCQLQ